VWRNGRRTGLKIEKTALSDPFKDFHKIAFHDGKYGLFLMFGRFFEEVQEKCKSGTKSGTKFSAAFPLPFANTVRSRRSRRDDFARSISMTTLVL
jgi:hypothetical protein